MRDEFVHPLARGAARGACDAYGGEDLAVWAEDGGDEAANAFILLLEVDRVVILADLIELDTDLGRIGYGASMMQQSAASVVGALEDGGLKEPPIRPRLAEAEGHAAP